MMKKALLEFIETINDEMNKLKKYIIANPLMKDSLEKLNLDSRFYDVTYTQLVEKDKVYITDKEGYDKLFGRMDYYTSHINGKKHESQEKHRSGIEYYSNHIENKEIRLTPFLFADHNYSNITVLGTKEDD